MLKEIISHQNYSLFRMRFAFLCTRIMNTPCWCLLSLLVFILYKNLSLTPLQITIIIALKPVSSILSPYWSLAIYQRRDKIIANLAYANILRHLPFLFIPWVESSWFIIASFGLYMMFTRATIPAWMELFKYHLPQTKREEMVGYWTVIDYLGTAIFAVILGMLLDGNPNIWRWLFALSAAVGTLSTFFLGMIPSLQAEQTKESLTIQKFHFKDKIVAPWQRVWKLILERKDFAHFQIGFMFGGAGLMIMQPALPQFFIDVLHLSFTEMGIAISLCKGVGVAITSPFWTRLFRKANIFQLTSLVTFFAALFPFFLLATTFHFSLLYLAYAFYGIMQAGSELSWHMSGLVFSQENDSSTFSSTNVLTVGIRGCIVPALGGMLLSIFHPFGVILSGAFLCLFACGYLLFNSPSATFEKII